MNRRVCDRAAILLAGISLLAPVPACAAGQPSDAVIAEARRKVRAKPGRIELPDAGALVPMVGKPEVPTVEAMLNGRGPYRLLVDTGANVTLLKAHVARELDLPVLRPGESSQLVKLDEMRLGDAIFGDMVVGARPWDEDGIDGVVGINVFQDVLLTFDYPARCLRVTKGRVENDRDHVQRPENEVVLPYDIGDDGCPWISFRVGGHPMRALLDTGAAGTIHITPERATGLTLEAVEHPDATQRTLYNEYKVEYSKLIGKVEFGGLVVESPGVTITKEEPELIGSKLLLPFELSVDQRTHLVRLRRPESPVGRSPSADDPEK